MFTPCGVFDYLMIVSVPCFLFRCLHLSIDLQSVQIREFFGYRVFVCLHRLHVTGMLSGFDLRLLDSCSGVIEIISS